MTQTTTERRRGRRAGVLVGLGAALGVVVGPVFAGAALAEPRPHGHAEVAAGQCREIRTGHRVPCGEQLPEDVRKCAGSVGAGALAGWWFGGAGGVAPAAVGAAIGCIPW